MVMLLHGFPDHPRSFGPVMARLVDTGYRVVAPWMRGYYPSILDGPYHLDRLALDIIELTASLSPNRPIFAVGHDWGAASLYYAIADAPSRFQAAVALSVPHPLMFWRSLRRYPMQIGRSAYMLLFQLPWLPERLVAGHDFAFVDRLWRLWSPGYVMPQEARNTLHACMRASMPAPLAYYRALLRPPREFLAQLRGSVLARPIAVPTLYLHGRRDGCIGVDVALSGDAGELFTAPYESMVIEHAGHFLQLEAPDMVAGFIIDWLQEFPLPGVSLQAR